MEKNRVQDRNPIKEISEITRTNLHKEVSSVRFIAGGSFGRAFRVTLSDGSSIVVKTYRIDGMQNDEAKQLDILRSHTTVPMPDVLFTHQDKTLSALGMSLIPGSNVLNPIFLTKKRQNRTRFASDVVSGMFEWHRIGGEKYGDLLAPTHSSWLEYYTQNKLDPTLTGLEQLVKEKKFSDQKYALLCRATELFDQYITEPEKPVLIHGDLNIMNIMADPKTFQLTGFIDPCGTMWADRDYDLYQLQNMWGDKFGLFQTYKERLKSCDDHLDFKVAFYGAISECSCRISPGHVFPIWEDLCINRLRKTMKQYR